MPKHKIARKSPTMDMTAMCDVAFLLLTFFILTAQVRISEPIPTNPPAAVNETQIPDKDVFIITVGRDGRILFDIKNQTYKHEIIQDMGPRYGFNLTPEEEKKFATGAGFGSKMQDIKKYLNYTTEELNDPINTPGIPVDTANNELFKWILESRMVVQSLSYPPMPFIIKADSDTPYPAIEKVIQTLQDQKVNKFNIVTSMEADPRKKESH